MPASGLAAADTAYVSLSAQPEAQKQGQVSLAWNASPDVSVVGYVVYLGTNSGIYYGSYRVGRTTSVTLKGLDEGVKFYFNVAAHDASGFESPTINEVVYTTPFYVSLRQKVWEVSAYGGRGKTNIMQSSTNLTQWNTMLTWVGTGNLTNATHTNVTKSFFRATVK